MNKQRIYESFHKSTKHIRRLPERDNFTYGTILKFIEKALRNRTKKMNKMSILDVGCGAGQISFYFAQKGHLVYGIDISEQAIKSCNQTKKLFAIKNAWFVKRDVSQLRFKKRFDLVIASELIEHIENDSKLLKDIRSLLKKDGLLLLTTPSENAPLFKLGLLDKFDERVGHLRRYNANDLLRIIKKQRFKDISIEKQEGILRNFLYTFRVGSFPLKVIHKISLLGKFVNKLDRLLLKMFGESDFFVLARKK